MKRQLNNRSGSGYVIVLAFAGILLIFFMIFGTFKSGQQQLQSKDVRRFVTASLGETALNCIISELNANRAFSTHRYYREKGDEYWNSPVKERETLLGDMGKVYVSGVKKGVYQGGSQFGEFKAKVAPIFSARENSKTQTLLEAEMYTRAEIVVKVGAGWGIQEETCRKITAMIERRYPATENVLYDGELLDLGSLGPFPSRENQLRRGRLYGYNWITFNTAGGACRGSELFDMEKIETPGFIRALKDTRISFADGSILNLSSANDSIQMDKFDPREGYIVDGANGAHPIKLARLPRERIKATAYRYRKSYGLILEKNMLPEGKYSNPYDPGKKYVDINFGDYRVLKSASKSPDRQDEDAEGGAVDEEEEGETSPETDYTTGSDDPEVIRKLRGDRILIYTEVPLRVWGCPDRSVTIYSTEDIIVGGDFNQNPRTPQLYENDDYINYRFPLENGKERHKIGAMLMSEKRVIIDVSRPTLFARNELKPFFLYSLAKTLHPSTPEIEAEIKYILCPLDPNNRKALIGLGELGTDGNFMPRYGTIAWLYNNKEVNSGGQYQANLEDMINFFTPGGGDKPRFGINDDKVRNDIIEYFKTAVRDVGDLTTTEQDRLFDMAWNQAVIEEDASPNPYNGAMGLMMGLFEEARKDPSDGLFIPEITINAVLVSSTRRASRFSIGNTAEKVDDEIGNAGSYQYMRPPGFIIQRVYGGVIRLASKEPEYYISGAHTGSNILRRRIWDRTNLYNKTFRPLESPAAHNLLTYTEEMISEKEYNNF
ncbi:MAG: hypothetical protein CVV41_10975 [Candidatus Riflebacteria bacterium HGW-Riflebacteria-1]|jgi:hypothetical protein|nr:MAG: hypothetical protein CVV41_10975 [Candidatus Riflebacteria bacterium HGW-Riflebacteria-1]